MAKDANGNEIPYPAAPLPPAISQPASIGDNFGIIPGSGVPFGGVLRPGVTVPTRPILPQSVGEVTDHLTNPKDWVSGSGVQGGPSGSSGAEVPVFPGTPGQMQGNEDAMAGLRAEMELDMGLMGGSHKPPPAFYADAHEEYSGVGGKRGKELFERAYGDGPDAGPQRLQDAVRQSEAAQGQKQEAMVKFYDQEAERATLAAAQRKAALEQDAQEMRVRQENLEQATQHYTNDLADQGKFWTNPGNIIAAISFSLMPIFSNDPAIGVKLINQAIQQDLDHRRQAATGTLGALRSNLQGYHQIVGDRQAADQLAEAEARRIAAMEVERIAAKFESPIAKAKAEAIIQDLRIKTAQGYMQAYSQAKLFQPAAKMDPELYKRRTKGYPGAWTSMGVEDVAPLQSVGNAVNGNIKGSPSQAQTNGPNGGFTPHVGPDVRALVRAGASPAAVAKLAMEGRVPGSANMYNLLSVYVDRQATAMSKGLSYGPAYDHAKQVIINDAKKETDKVPGLSTGPQGFAGRKATLGNLIADADAITASERAIGKNEKDFLGSLYTISPSFAQKYEELYRTFASRGGNPAEIREQSKKEAQMFFRQRLQSELAKTYSDISGGAITPSETPRLEGFISKGSDFGFVYNWLKEKSVDINGKEQQALSGLSPLAKIYYMTRTGVGQRAHGLPVRAMAGPKKAPEGQGEFSGLESRKPFPGKSE